MTNHEQKAFDDKIISEFLAPIEARYAALRPAYERAMERAKQDRRYQSSGNVIRIDFHQPLIPELEEILADTPPLFPTLSDELMDAITEVMEIMDREHEELEEIKRLAAAQLEETDRELVLRGVIA